MAGGGVLIDTLVHSIDIFRALAGEIVRVDAATSTTLPVAVEDSASMQVISASGAIGSLNCSWVTPVSEAEVRIYGTEGEAVVDYARPDGLRYRLTGDDEWTTMPFDGPDRFVRQAEHFLTCVQVNPAVGERPGRGGGDEGHRGAYVSAQRRRGAEKMQFLLQKVGCDTMKLSISMWSVVSVVKAGKMDLPGFIEFAARQQENGAQGVELLDYFWRDRESELPKAKRQIADAGLGLGIYSIGNDFFQPDRGAWQKQLEDLKTGVEVAGQLGAPVLRVFSGNAKPGYTLEDGLTWIIDGLAAGADYASRHGITLALENHGLMAGRSDQVRKIIEAVGSPALRANLDTGNFLLVDQNPTDAAQGTGRHGGARASQGLRQGARRPDGACLQGAGWHGLHRRRGGRGPGGTAGNRRHIAQGRL